MWIHCEYCGAEFNSNQGVCPKCGAAVAGNKEIEEQKERDDKIAEEIKTAMNAETKKSVEEFDKEHPYRTRMSSRNVNILKAVGLVLAVIIVILGLVLAIMILKKF